MNPSGLGKAIINRKIKDARTRQESGLVSLDHLIRQGHSNESSMLLVY